MALFSAPEQTHGALVIIIRLSEKLALRTFFHIHQSGHCTEDVALLEIVYFLFTPMPNESYRRQLRSLLLCLCALINSLVC